MNLMTFDQLPAAVKELSEKVDRIEQLLSQRREEPEKSQDTLLTVAQTADFLSLTIPTIYSKVSRRELPVMKRGKRLYFSKSELREYLKEGRRKTLNELSLQADNYLNKS